MSEQYNRTILESLLAKADRYKAAIDQARPLGAQEMRNLQDYFKIGLTYTSNALEGNTLDLTETKILLEEGLTVAGKPIRDCYEAIGHGKAYEYMQEAAKARPLLLTEHLINRLHFLFYQGIDHESAGVYRRIPVYISGTEYVPPSPGDLPRLMARFVNDMNERRGQTHPVEWAAQLHKGLVGIHPYVDGNGRTARLLMNLALVNAGYGIAIIPPVERREYIASLVQAQNPNRPDPIPFTCFIAERVVESQRDYCRMLSIPLQ